MSEVRKRVATLRLHPGAADAHDAELCRAVGYLALWAAGSRHALVDIAGDEEGDLEACYRDEEGNTTYVIGAVRGDDGRYSFHS